MGFYVYAIMDGETVLYVGKGTGRRAKASARKHGGKESILEEMECETTAFERECFWIAELSPQNNISAGGNGGRVRAKSKYELPRALVGVISQSQWRKDVKAQEALELEIAAIGSRKYAAKSLCERLNEHNCELWGVSKVDLNRLREVAYG